MPLTKSKSVKPDPNKVYTAWDGFAWENIVVAKGERLRGSTPVVQAVPSLFVEDGTPPHEWPSAFDHVLDINLREQEERKAKERAEFEQAAARNKVKLSVVAIKTCKADYLTFVNSQPACVLKGSKALESDPVVQMTPEAWS